MKIREMRNSITLSIVDGNVLARSHSSDTDVNICDMYADIYGEQQRAQGFDADALRHLKSAQVCKRLLFFFPQDRCSDFLVRP